MTNALAHNQQAAIQDSTSTGT